MADSYSTIQGDMWDTVAYRIWGNEKLMHKLMAANPAHRDTVVFPSGVRLAVPELDAELTRRAMDPPWK